jgi:hypothetical protein
MVLNKNNGTTSNINSPNGTTPVGVVVSDTHFVMNEFSTSYLYQHNGTQIRSFIGTAVHIDSVYYYVRESDNLIKVYRITDGLRVQTLDESTSSTWRIVATSGNILVGMNFASNTGYRYFRNT